MALRLFVDFDGTVTTEDVGNVFFRHFGGAVCDDYIREYRAGGMSARECFRKETEAIGRLPVQEAIEFLLQRTLTPGFPEFVVFCRDRAVDFSIVSDGLDFYVRAILAAHGLTDVRSTANRFAVGPEDPDGKASVAITFPHDDAECDRCACCKRNIMITSGGEGDVIGYIGDGFSDRCAVQYADLVFARGDLQRYCQENNISYFVYASFHDVIARLEDLLARKRLRRRRRAQLKRQDVLASEP